MARPSIVVSLVTSTVLARSSSAKNARRASIPVSPFEYSARDHPGVLKRIPHILGACGIVDPGSIESWTCDLCQNEKTAEASLVRLPRYSF